MRRADAPLATVDIGVELPATAAEPQPRPDKPVFVTVKPNLNVAVGEDVVARDALSASLDAATNGHKDERIYLRADKAVSYGDLMEVMNTLRNAGYLKVALVGLGYWGPNLLRSLASMAGSEHIVVVDRALDRVATACAQYPATIGYESLEQALTAHDI